jgi:hypothetical protein
MAIAALRMAAICQRNERVTVRGLYHAAIERRDDPTRELGNADRFAHRS